MALSPGNLVHDEDEIDDDVEERLAEDHKDDESRAKKAAEELRTEGRSAKLAAHHEGIPI